MSEVIILDCPLTNRGIFKNGVISIITIRTPIVKDLIGLEFNSSINQSMITLVSRLTGLKENDVLTIAARDWFKIQEVISRLTQGPRK